MPHQTKRHPEPLIAAITQAATRGIKGIEIHKRINEGTLDGWDGPYSIPKSGVYTYIRDHKKALNAKGQTIAPDGGLSAGIHAQAVRIFNALTQRLDAELQGREPVSIGFLDDVAKTLKTLDGLAKNKPSTPPANASSEGQDADEKPVTDPILLAARDRQPVPDTPLVSEGKTEKAEDAKWRSQMADTKERDDADAGSVPSDSQAA